MSVGTIAPEARRPAPGTAAARARTLLSNTPVVAVGALTVLAVILRFSRIGHQGFWFDEGNTVRLVHLSPGQMIGQIPETESTPPLYYCVAWVWARVFGYGESGLRSLSALAGVLTTPVAYAAGIKLISRRAGVIAAALVACNPFLIWYSQEARSYSLLVLLTSVSLLAFAYARAEPTARYAGAWVIASALAMGTHYYALLAIIPQAVWLLVIHRRERSVQAGIAIVGACGLALIPLAISQNGTGNASWIAGIALLPRLGQIIPQFLTGTGSPIQEVLQRLGEAIVVLALVLLLRRSDPPERRAALSVGALAIGGLALNLLLIAGGIDDLITRNVIALWLPAALMVAGGLGARRAGAVGIVAAVVLCATGVIAAVGVASDRNLQRPDWRAVAHVLGARPAPGVGARVIVEERYGNKLPLSLYLPRLSFWIRDPLTVSEVDVVSIGAPRVRLCWWGAACNLFPSKLQSTYPIPGFHELWRRRALQFTIVRLVSSSPVVLTRQDVSRALTTTRHRRDGLLIQR